VNFDDLHYLMQLNQGAALTLGVEWFRSRQPTNMGTLLLAVERLLARRHKLGCDRWRRPPEAAVVCHAKVFRGIFAGRSSRSDGSLSLYLINDQDATMVVSNMQVTRWTFDREHRASQWLTCDVPREPSTACRSIETWPLPAILLNEFIHFGDQPGRIGSSDG